MADEDEVVRLLARAAAEMGRRGGRARATKMTAERRSQIARQAAYARWRKDQEDGE